MISKSVHFRGVSVGPQLNDFLGPSELPRPKGILIGSATLAQVALFNRQTHGPLTMVTLGCILRYTW